ncbi:hypothetical protein BGX27_008283 [Mortierella sp. AM989]|nr:hypothetical protein BGX27_008283 [Mortierella sp. AM989]
MTSTTGTWSSLFQGMPNTTPASQLYTEEAIQNDQLTSEEVIEKAQSSASLLYEIVTALSEEHETLQSFEKNDILQTIFQECQEMSSYLSARIWNDSGDSNTRYQLFDSSSSRAPQKTVDEEIQIATFISCNEQIQVAIRRFNEFKDYLSAKSLQETELAGEDAYRSSYATDDFGREIPSRIDPSSTYTAAAVTLDDGDDDDDENEGYGEGKTINTHLRRSEQSLVWKLDPREDFKAGQTKMKKINLDEWRKNAMVRHMEKDPRNGVHGLIEDPYKITPEMLSDDDIPKGEASQEESAVESAATPLVEVDEDGLEKIINRPQAIEAEEDDDHEDAKSVLSDDSWEEIPTQGIVNLSIEGEAATQKEDAASPISSSVSSFTMVPVEASSRSSTPPSADIREL